MDINQIKEFAARWFSKIPLRYFSDPDPVVSVLRLSGVIGQLGPARSGLTLEGLEKSIERAFSGKRVKTVALVINSPGGSPVQSAQIARRIREHAEEKDIPVVAFAEDIAASGGYWLACAADEIFADANSIIGSIGVISAGFGFTAAIAKIGIERRVHSMGKRKGMLDPFKAEAPEDIARLKAIQMDIHDSFKQMVIDRRGDKLNVPDTNELFEGDIWTGSQAQSLGLIDGLGDLRPTMREIHGERVKFRAVSPKSNPVKKLLGSREDRARQNALSAISVIEEWAAWNRYGM
ncbi:MAG: S49 family peptidase [Rhodospirillaceae bacterium]|nr:S49 family peptidase [Rhodospirillaceae bacterium]|tara:strand:+ start:3920 stop:4795 length:876 start_codon:yes stop_codon:yes gene_type:complete